MTKRKAVAPAASRIRCAVYTRKSSEEGLEKSYNSLDAQRDACEAYVMSQTGEGWSALPARYDDGGFSGGTMERPGLKQLLTDIAMNRIDVVVVYKVDRLTRSLTDFARIVDTFDSHKVSFVSVTQAFNTTSSMGRLTLNVLLSFAQFEREVTGERIRDKIAASKRRGMWMGGTPPMGYRAENRTLAIDEAEAATVRHIYQRYLELQSVRLLREELEAQGIRSPGRRTSEPRPFGRGALYHLLGNRLYLGEIVHKDASYPGLHMLILDRELFEAVGALIESKRIGRRESVDSASRAPLTGLIFDDRGAPMSPVFTRNRHGRIYRYYVSAGLQTGTLSSGQGTRVAAVAVEAIVRDRLDRVMPGAGEAGLRRHLQRIDIDGGAITITLKSCGKVPTTALDPADSILRMDSGEIQIVVPGQIRRWRGSSNMTRSDQFAALTGVRIDRSMVRGLGRAHMFVEDVKGASSSPRLAMPPTDRPASPIFADWRSWRSWHPTSSGPSSMGSSREASTWR